VNLNTIMQVRHQIRPCFSRSGDALFELADALTAEAGARSLPELSLSPLFRRQWSSVYAALEDGHIETQRWSRVWTAALLSSHEGAVWMSVDSTSIARPEAETSSDRGMISVCNLPHARHSSERRLAVLDDHAFARSAEQLGSHLVSETHPERADGRLGRSFATGAVAHPPARSCSRAGRSLLGYLRLSPGLSTALDRGSLAPQTQSQALSTCTIAVPRKTRAPRKDGTLFQGSRSETWGEPEQEWKGCDEQGRPLLVPAWHRLPFRQARPCRGERLSCPA
jgi:hypothetical protein